MQPEDKNGKRKYEAPEIKDLLEPHLEGQSDFPLEACPTGGTNVPCVQGPG
jgi:hypothetical protein